MAFSATNQPDGRGRPKGSNSKRLTAFKAGGDKLLTNLMKQANDGEIEAQKMVLPFMPKPRNYQEKVTFTIAGTSLTDKANSVLQAVSNAQISPEIGTSLIASITSIARIVELTELMERIEALEK